MTPVRFVLVRARNALNMGAVARAMANFGLRDLVAVEPYALNWRRARSAVGAGGVMRSARTARSVAEAVSGCSLVLGTFGGSRALRQETLSLAGLGGFLRERLASGGRLAVLFGSEKTGLRNQDLQFCHALLSIPTRPESPSMNLGQAAAVIAWELSRRELDRRPRAPSFPVPTPEQVEDLVDKAAAALRATGYLLHMPEPARKEKLRRMFLRWRMTRGDGAFLQAVFKRTGNLVS